MIEMGKQYKTRDGRDVRLLMIEGTPDYPVIGAVEEDEGYEPQSWTADGVFVSGSPGSDFDLIEVKPERTLWLNVYPTWVGMNMHLTRGDADKYGNYNRIACVPVTYREGDGL